MTAKFRRKTWRGISASCTVGQVVIEIVNNSAFGGSGQIEALRNHLDRLAEIVGELANMLPDDKQDEFVNRIASGYTRIGDAK